MSMHIKTLQSLTGVAQSGKEQRELEDEYLVNTWRSTAHDRYKFRRKIRDVRLEGLQDVGCAHLGFAPYHEACAHPLPKSPLRSSVKMAFLVARIGAQNDPCVHPFQK